MTNQTAGARPVESDSTLYEELLDLSSDVICSIDPSGQFQFLNKAVFKAWGYLPEELRGRNLFDLVVKDDHHRTRMAIETLTENRTSLSFENRCIRKDGTTVHLRWSLQLESAGKNLLGVVRLLAGDPAPADIHARFEKEIKKQHQEMREMLGRISDGFFAMDRDLRITYINPQVEKLLNVKREDYLSRSFSELFPDMMNSVFYEQYSEALRTNEPTYFESYFQPFDLWFSANAYPSETGLSVFFRDITERVKEDQKKRQTKLMLSRQNRRIEQLAEGMKDSFYFVDRSFSVVYWNRQMEAMTGLSREEVLKKSIFDIFPEEDKESYISLFKNIAATKEPFHEELKCPILKKWVDVSINPSPDGLFIFIRDIDARKKTEEELRKLSLIARETENAVSMTTPDGKITWVNAAYERITGYSSEEVIGKTSSQILSGPETSADTLRFLKEQYQKGNSFHVEIINYKMTGEKFWSELHGQPLLDDKGEVKEYFCIRTDITERKQAEEELEKLSLVARLTDNIVAITTPDRMIVWVNEAFTRITGYSSQEAVGRSVSEIFDGPDTDPEVIQYVREKKEKQEAIHVEALNYKKNGETYWANISCYPVVDSEGRVQHFFSIATDITEQKKMQRAIDSDKEERQKMITAAFISGQEKIRAEVGRELHDNVNQVLTTVKLYTELCRDGVGDVPSIMNRSLLLLQDSINEIRSLSKRLSAPTLGKIRLKDSVTELLDSVSATNKVSITLEMSSLEDLEVEQDIHLAIYRILQEQLTNVLKYAEAENVKISIQLSGKQLSLMVKDDGVGFDTGHKRNGIGITNMTTRAESLNGWLEIQSVPGCGCELKVVFPFEQ